MIATAPTPPPDLVIGIGRRKRIQHAQQRPLVVGQRIVVRHTAGIECVSKMEILNRVRQDRCHLCERRTFQLCDGLVQRHLLSRHFPYGSLE